jgi:predicted nucleic acid-binding protein
VAIQQTTTETAKIFTDIILALRKRGKQIPTDDIGIAAIAVETGSILMSRDQHFTYIDQIKVVDLDL